MQNRRFNLAGQAKPSNTQGLMGTGQGSDHQDSASLVIGQVWDHTELCLQFQPSMIAGFLNT